MRLNLKRVEETIRAAGSDLYGPNRHAVWNATCVAREYLGEDITESEVKAVVFAHARLEWTGNDQSVRVVRDKPECLTDYIAGLRS